MAFSLDCHNDLVHCDIVQETKSHFSRLYDTYVVEEGHINNGVHLLPVSCCMAETNSQTEEADS